MSRKTPLWQSIADTLTQEISDGRYRVGDKLPTEARMAQRFGVNRHTVRAALQAMINQDLVHSRRGAGTFVTQPPTQYPIGSRVRYSKNLAAVGRLPGRKALVLETRPASAREAEMLDLAPQENVHVYEGVAEADNAPIGTFCSIFPAARFPDMLKRLAGDPSTTAVFETYGIVDYTRRFTHLSAVIADATQARHLRLRDHSPILRSEAVNIDPEGAAIEYGRTWFAGERITLTIAD